MTNSSELYFHNEKQSSFDWLFKNFKGAWNTGPQVFVTDQCNEITQGLLFR